MVRYSFGTRLTRLSDEEGRNRAGTCITVMTLEEFRETKELYLHRKVMVHSMEKMCIRDSFYTVHTLEKELLFRLFVLWIGMGHSFFVSQEE